MPPPRWWEAAAVLEPWLDQASVVLTTSELDALYYFGDYDVLLEKSRLSEQPSPVAEFDRDPRTERPIISTPKSVALIIDCFPDGVIVADTYRWRNPAYLGDATADLIVQRTEPIPLDANARILAFRWAHGDTRASEACADLRQIVRSDPPS
jgi:hypothetical protein